MCWCSMFSSDFFLRKYNIHNKEQSLREDAIFYETVIVDTELT